MSDPIIADLSRRVTVLEKVEARLKKLEDKITPPNGPGLGEQVQTAMERLDELAEEVDQRATRLDERLTKEIKEAYRILAELKGKLGGTATGY